MKYLIPFIALVLLGAGCATMIDEDGCPLNNYDSDYILECHEKVRCIEAGGFPSQSFNGRYTGCTFPK